MEYYVVIPAHNEEDYLAEMLDSLLAQTILPKKIVIVNDHSTDGTEAIIDTYTEKSTLLQKLNRSSAAEHMPGSKVIEAFNHGLTVLDNTYDVIVKLDADLLLPPTYFERIAQHFTADPSIGIAGGFIYEKTSTGDWKINHPMDKDHIRGAFKAYSKACFNAIGGLKNAMGWDTIDELLAKYHGFSLLTDTSLVVKHLRPTGKSYTPKTRTLQGKAMYTMRYGFLITCIASLKMAYHQKSIGMFKQNMTGFFNAKKAGAPFLINKEEGAFIRRLRWKNIRGKILK